ncbi:hypothetical protein L211DRAFT_901552 [Terfezia boudieri ATCC MYA-4762]|uniref:Uncharacterized protein n=1 Tax=Terfezia boudieri ATCC MYA-4762 TaxID=1051890 RepID=A0A3N4M0C8_9PEZI|nr:hypothetical protein L211DRAFT_901552 [Terfezia boudieri ATCC MYA-4762]
MWAVVTRDSMTSYSSGFALGCYWNTVRQSGFISGTEVANSRKHVSTGHSQLFARDSHSTNSHSTDSLASWLEMTYKGLLDGGRLRMVAIQPPFVPPSAWRARPTQSRLPQTRAQDMETPCSSGIRAWNFSRPHHPAHLRSVAPPLPRLAKGAP